MRLNQIKSHCATTIFNIISKENAELLSKRGRHRVFVCVLCFFCCVRALFIPWILRNRTPHNFNSIDNVCICYILFGFEIVVPSIWPPKTSESKLPSIQSKPVAERIKNWKRSFLIRFCPYFCPTQFPLLRIVSIRFVSVSVSLPLCFV